MKYVIGWLVSQYNIITNHLFSQWTRKINKIGKYCIKSTKLASSGNKSESNPFTSQNWWVFGGLLPRQLKQHSSRALE